MNTKNTMINIISPVNDGTDTNLKLESSSTPAPETRVRKPRRSNKEIQAEYEQFKTLLEEGRPVLEICHVMQIRMFQCSTYLAKIGLEKTNIDQQYGACQGHCLPQSILKALGGGRQDLFKFEVVENGVLVSLHMPLNENVTLTNT